MNVGPEQLACDIEWWLQNAPMLKPAMVAYACKYMDDKSPRRDNPKLVLANLLNMISHAITNFCRDEPRYSSKASEFKKVLVNNGQTLTRTDGFEDLVYLPTICPILADYLNEPLLIALALLAAGKQRIQTSFVRELIPSEDKMVSRFLVRTYQGHMVTRAETMINDRVGMWTQLDPAEAAKLLVVHSTDCNAACHIMRPYGTMRPKHKRGYLHFATANNSMTLGQMEQLREESCYLILHIKWISEEYEVWKHAVGTITLRKDGRLIVTTPALYPVLPRQARTSFEIQRD